MTPAARVAAAIDILDVIFTGEAAEKAISVWGRGHRFAGSKDRAAIRDHVFQALRRRASFAWLGGTFTGRGVMIGAMRAAGLVDDMFTGAGYGADPLGEDEDGQALETADRATRLDMPAWMLPLFDAVLGDKTDETLALMQDRAGVFLRVNTGLTDLATAQARLAEEDIKTIPVDGVKTALQVIENERRVANSTAYADGLVELQDPSSQAAVASLNIDPDCTVLDYCAGGGGKALALAALGAQVSAHDIDPRRMNDIEPRAQRAGVTIDLVDPDDVDETGTFDMVFCDAPCTGSGTWRRAPEAKWALTPERLAELVEIQQDVLQKACAHVKSGGRLVYATCSVFAQENADQIAAFLAQHDDFTCLRQTHILPCQTRDGFFISELKRRK